LTFVRKCPTILLNRNILNLREMIPEMDPVTPVLLRTEENPTLIRPLIVEFYDSEFQAGVINLLEGLSSLIERSIEWEIQILPEILEGREEDVLDELDDILELLEGPLGKDRLSKGEGNEDQNPFVAGKVSLRHHELAALVCDLPMDRELHPLFDLIRLLFLKYAWSSDETIGVRKETALELRKFSPHNAEAANRRECLGILPILEDSARLATILEVLRVLPEPSDPPYMVKWYDALKRLDKFWSEGASEKAGSPGDSKRKPKSRDQVSVPKPKREAPQDPPTPQPAGGESWDPFAMGKPRSVSVQLGKRLTGEPPADLPAVELDLLQDVPEALTVFLGTARFWLQDIYSLTPVSPCVLDQEAREILLDFFSVSGKHDAVLVREARLLLELSFVTGLTLERLLEASVGPLGVISSGGLYTRQLTQPDKSFCPEGDEAEKFRSLLKQFSLELPKDICPKLDLLMPKAEKRPLNLCMRSSADQLLDAAKRLLQDLNEEHELELTIESVALALRNSVYLTTKSPVLTLHIAGLDGYAPPTMGWYQGVDEEKLRSTYDLAIEALYRNG
jgi:hypothetical protein